MKLASAIIYNREVLIRLAIGRVAYITAYGLVKLFKVVSTYLDIPNKVAFLTIQKWSLTFKLKFSIYLTKKL